VALIDAAPRSATCTASTSSVILELEDEPYRKMYNDRELAAFRFHHMVTMSILSQVRNGTDHIRKLVKNAKKEPDNAHSIFSGMKDAFRSVIEMGIDIEEVDYVVYEGQRDDAVRARNAKALDK